MRVSLDDLMRERPDLIQCSSSYAAFEDTSDDDPSRAALWIWRNALADDGLARCFSDAKWPLDLLESLPPGPDWRWYKLAHGRDSIVRPRDWPRSRQPAAMMAGRRVATCG